MKSQWEEDMNSGLHFFIGFGILGGITFGIYKIFEGKWGPILITMGCLSSVLLIFSLLCWAIGCGIRKFSEWATR